MKDWGIALWVAALAGFFSGLLSMTEDELKIWLRWRAL